LLGGKPRPFPFYASSTKRAEITPKDKAARVIKLRNKHHHDAFRFRVGKECGHDQDERPGRTDEIVPLIGRPWATMSACWSTAKAPIRPRRRSKSAACWSRTASAISSSPAPIGNTSGPRK
jgi:hypothetical protein